MLDSEGRHTGPYPSCCLASPDGTWEKYSGEHRNPGNRVFHNTLQSSPLRPSVLQADSDTAGGNADNIISQTVMHQYFVVNVLFKMASQPKSILLIRFEARSRSTAGLIPCTPKYRDHHVQVVCICQSATFPRESCLSRESDRTHSSRSRNI